MWACQATLASSIPGIANNGSPNRALRPNHASANMSRRGSRSIAPIGLAGAR